MENSRSKASYQKAWSWSNSCQLQAVSNLSFISKVIEWCMLLQSSEHCREYNLQPDYQSAYREDYSCETAILKISDNILWAMEKQSITALIALDLSAAFDMVDHNILLDILTTKFGIEEKSLQWFREYLRPWSFKVIINNKYSEEKDLTLSVPQGSCAGVNIFNLYCSPLHLVIPDSLQLSGFADKHSVRKAFKASDRSAEESTIKELEQCMVTVKNWMDELRLKMNLSKTELIYFGFSKQLEKCTIRQIDVAGDLIIRSDLIKYLGVWMDAAMTFKQHIAKKCQVATLNLKRIRSIRHLITTDIAVSLCLSLCISHMDYCNSVLYGLPKSSLDKFQRIQNMCACLVLRKNMRESATQCLQELHWLPIKQRIEFKMLTLI